MAERSLRPNLFVVGAAKCGTTSLHRVFELAPGIGTARTRKELHFFSAPELVARTAGPGDGAIPEAIVQDEASYLEEFGHLAPPGDGASPAATIRSEAGDPGALRQVAAPVIADVSPSYLQNPAAAARIHGFAPEARIVILLREPAAKVFSQYVHLWGEGREDLDFDDAFAASAARRAAGFSDMFDYDAGGRYAEGVARYLDRFGPERVLVLLFESMVADWAGARARLERFLGVPLPEGPLPRMNTGGRLRSPLAAAVLGSERLRAGLRAVVPLGLRTRLGERLRGSLATDKPVLGPETRARLRRHFADDVAALERLIGPTGWPAA